MDKMDNKVILNEQNCQKMQIPSGHKKKRSNENQSNSNSNGLLSKKPKLSKKDVKDQPKLIFSSPKEPCNDFLKVMHEKRLLIKQQKNAKIYEEKRSCKMEKCNENSSDDEVLIDLVKHKKKIKKGNKIKQSLEDEWVPLGSQYSSFVYTKTSYQLKTSCRNGIRSHDNVVILVNDCVEIQGEHGHNYFAKVRAIWVGFDDEYQKEYKLSVMWFYSKTDEIKQKYFVKRINKEDSSSLKLHYENERVQDETHPEKFHNITIMHEDEVYFSNHYDCISASTVIRRCYVLTYNHFCRVQERLKQGKKGSCFDKHEPDRNNNPEEENNKFFYQRPLLENEVGYEKKKRKYYSAGEDTTQNQRRLCDKKAERG